MTPPIVGRSVQIERNGTILGAVSSVTATQNNRTVVGYPNLHPVSFPKGVSGNPGGRPKLARAPSAALAELNDMIGDTPEEAIDAFKVARGKALCAADHKAIAMFRAESDVERRTHVQAFESVTDRLEGKVPQAMNVKSEATLTIQIVPLYAMMDGKRAPELLEAEVVEEGEK